MQEIPLDDVIELLVGVGGVGETHAPADVRHHAECPEAKRFKLGYPEGFVNAQPKFQIAPAPQIRNGRFCGHSFPAGKAIEAPLIHKNCPRGRMCLVENFECFGNNFFTPTKVGVSQFMLDRPAVIALHVSHNLPPPLSSQRPKHIVNNRLATLFQKRPLLSTGLATCVNVHVGSEPRRFLAYPLRMFLLVCFSSSEIGSAGIPL
ncbi:hypothetical protein ES705_50633 [subsurface metagenome]